MNVEMRPLDWFVSGPDRRPTNQSGVDRLAESIAAVGLIHPVSAKPDGWLIDGAHRIEAYRLLGRDAIPTIIRDDSELMAQLVEIDGNLCRVNLTPMQETVAVARRKEVYEALHPETKWGGNVAERERNPDGTLSNQSPQNEDSGSRPPSFVQDTAAKTGKSPKTIERDVRIGRAFNEDEIEKLTEAKVPILDVDKLASLRRPERMPARVNEILEKPVSEIKAAIQPLMAIKDERRTSAGRRKKILTDLERRQESLARQSLEQRTARLEAGEMMEVDRLIERMERLTFRSCLEKIIAAATTRMARLEENTNASFTGNNGSGADAGIGTALAD